MARAMEDLVSRDSFGSLLVRMTENVMGVTQIATGAIDLVVRNLRIAGRPDVTRLARQIARTEDKLELVLQEVERLSEQLEALQPRPSPPARTAAPRPRGAARRAPDRDGADAGPDRARAGRRDRLREHPAHDAGRDDRRVAQGRRLDAPHDDALPLPLEPAHEAGAGPAGLRAHQPAGHLRPAPGQLVRGVPARRGLRRLPRRLGRARRGGPRRRPGLLRLRRPALGDARGPARERPGGAEPRRLVHRRRARGDARRDRPGQPGAQPRPAHDAGRHERLAVREVGRATGLRRRLRRRHARGRSPARASTS